MATRTHASPKADFILGLPSSLSVAEVVERAAAAGMSLSGSMVRKTRAAGPAQLRASSASAKRAKTRTRASGEAPARPGSKRAFVLSFPHDTPAGEIVSAAKTKGFQLPTGYVYWVRSDAARKARQGGPKAVSRASASVSASAGRAGRRAGGREPQRANDMTTSATAPLAHREAEGLLLQTALRVVGIERAIELLKNARERIDRLLQD